MYNSTPFMASESVVDSNRIIYTAADFAKSNLNYLQESGTLTALKIHESRRSALSSYLFFTVLRGSGTLTVEGLEYPMKAGDCAFVDCMQNYKHCSSHELWQLSWVHFNGAAMPGIYDKYRDRGGRFVFTPSAASFEKISDILDTVHKIAASDSYIRDMEINEHLSALLTEIMRNSWNPERGEGGGSKRRDIRDVREYLDTHYAEKISLDELSRIFYINKYYLTRIFKEQYGTTISNHLSEIRITSAKKQLRFTDRSIEQIALECGYSDANFFIRMFKRSERMTPGEFRSKWKT